MGALTIDGQQRVLKLTLGALAELEQELDTGSLVELVQRFESGAYADNWEQTRLLPMFGPKARCSFCLTSTSFKPIFCGPSGA